MENTPYFVIDLGDVICFALISSYLELNYFTSQTLKNFWQQTLVAGTSAFEALKIRFSCAKINTFTTLKQRRTYTKIRVTNSH